jgi:hypothetical protein
MTDNEVLKLALERMNGMRIFVNSKEKIKQPEGAEWFEEAIKALEIALSEREALAKQEKQVVSLQCAHCQVTIETLNDKVMSLLSKQSTECVEQRIDSEQLDEQGRLAWVRKFLEK